MSKVDFKKVDELNDKYNLLFTETMTECVKFIREVLEKRENKCIIIDNDSTDIEFLGIVYDGGNHPEYNSNICVEVKSIYIDNDNTIMLELDEDDIPLIAPYRVTFEDMINIAYYLNEYYND